MYNLNPDIMVSKDIRLVAYQDVPGVEGFYTLWFMTRDKDIIRMLSTNQYGLTTLISSVKRELLNFSSKASSSFIRQELHKKISMEEFDITHIELPFDV